MDEKLTNDIWLAQVDDLMDYILCDEWERGLLALTNPNTPAAFQAAIKKTLPAAVMSNWNRHCWGNRRRAWKGITMAAKQMHMHASFDFQVLNLGDESLVQTAANAILLAAPQVFGPAARDREKRLRQWDKLDYCRLCWRLVPAGGASNRRRPTCEHHSPRSKEYQSYYRLLPHYSDYFRQTKENVGLFAEWDGKLTQFPQVVRFVEERNGNVKNLSDVLQILLLDVPDPKNKIKKTIDDWLDFGDEFIFGTFLYAEAWLSLLASKQHGGDRKSKRSGSVYSAELQKKAVNRAIKSNKPVAKTAKKLGIPVSTLYTWIKKAKKSNS